MMQNQPAIDENGNAPGISGSPSHCSAYSIDAFCKAHDISRAFFYELGDAGLGPRLMKLGRRVLISQEAAADWRRETEERTAVQAQMHMSAERTDEGRTERSRAKSRPKAAKNAAAPSEKKRNARRTLRADDPTSNP